MEGAAVHRLGWSKPIQCDSVISLRYETHDLITVHLNEQVKIYVFIYAIWPRPHVSLFL